VDGKPAWWFDGSRILWVSNRTGDFEVWAADFDSATPAILNPENLTNEPLEDDLMPAMRPDGGSIMFVRGAAASDPYTMDPDGTNQEILFPGGTSSSDLNPAWGPWP
jgi:Tol biopolymer transport system component